MAVEYYSDKATMARSFPAGEQVISPLSKLKVWLAHRMSKPVFGLRLPIQRMSTFPFLTAPAKPSPSLDDAHKERIGAKAIRLGFVTEEQVTRALSDQQELTAHQLTQTPLGTLLVQKGVLAPAQLALLLSETAAGFRLSDDAVHFAATLRRSIDKGVKSIVMTSAGQGNGSGVIAAQVGLALALMDQGPVAVVDCDFRQPTMAQLFCVQGRTSALEVLIGRRTAAEALQSTGVTGLAVLPARESAGAAVAELLRESGATRLLELCGTNRVVIINTPPALVSPETAILASRADGTVIVVGAGVGRGTELSEVERLMESIGANVLGVVLSQGAQPDRKRSQKSEDYRAAVGE